MKRTDSYPFKRRRGEPGKVLINLCPRCRSTNIKLLDFTSGWLTPVQYVCHDCGFRGPLVIEAQVTEEEAKRLSKGEPIEKIESLREFLNLEEDEKENGKD
ncbi:MAG: hypothetical protein ACFFBS_00060 [Promethearchaeota archaeon]